MFGSVHVGGSSPQTHTTRSYGQELLICQIESTRLPRDMTNSFPDVLTINTSVRPASVHVDAPMNISLYFSTFSRRAAGGGGEPRPFRFPACCTVAF